MATWLPCAGGKAQLSMRRHEMAGQDYLSAQAEAAQEGSGLDFVAR